jgi:hypothetical protein
MSVLDNRTVLKSLGKGIVAATFGLGMMIGFADAAPIAPSSVPNDFAQLPITQARVVVVHHHHRPMVRHGRRQVCWWSHGRRVCRWR